jgi:hypothetical protein
MRHAGALPPAPALWPPTLNATDERHGSGISLGQCLGLGGVPFDPPSPGSARHQRRVATCRDRRSDVHEPN